MKRDEIVGHLEKGVRPWLKPWNTDYMAGRITFPLHHNSVQPTLSEGSYAILRNCSCRYPPLLDFPKPFEKPF